MLPNLFLAVSMNTILKFIFIDNKQQGVAALVFGGDGTVRVEPLRQCGNGHGHP
jgi:hypothetical protein